MIGAQRLVDAAKQTHAELGEVVLDLQGMQRRLARLRSDLVYAVTVFDNSAVIELPDDHHDPRG